MKIIKIILPLIIFSAVMFFVYNNKIDSDRGQQVPSETMEDSSRVMPPKEISLTVGQKANALNMFITLNEIVEDTRCVPDQPCSSEGSLTLNMTLQSGDQYETREYISSDKPLLFDGFNISIVSISPVFKPSSILDQSAYTITFLIESSYTGSIDVPPIMQDLFIPQTSVSNPLSSASLCATSGGTWVAQYQECLGVDSSSCVSIGGNWNECASACRNNPEAVVCTMQCELVCEM